MKLEHQLVRRLVMSSEAGPALKALFMMFIEQSNKLSFLFLIYTILLFILTLFINNVQSTIYFISFF